MVFRTPHNELITIDLHGYRFIEAKTELLDSIEGYYKQGFTEFQIIHGFKGGTTLKDYVRRSLKKDIERILKNCSLSLRSSSQGSTIVIISVL